MLPMATPSWRLRPTPLATRWARVRSPLVSATAVDAAAEGGQGTIVTRDDIRNIAIIAHVDHGKTTLVDQMLRQAGAFRSNQVTTSMDSNDQEKERGITILAKNCAVQYKDTKINIIDTPGHADFGGEVERIMNMVDGVLLVVDSMEGPKPQTRFVLKKALERGVRAIVAINKMDRPNIRPEYVLSRVFDLFVELNASDEQSDFQVVYTSGFTGISGLEPSNLQPNLEPLFEEILKLPPAKVDTSKSLQLLIANVDMDDYKGKLGIGRLVSGEITVGQDVLYGRPNPGPEGHQKGTIKELFVFKHIDKVSVEKAQAGEIVVIAGIDDIKIGDTIMSPATPEPLPPIYVEEPTVRMTVGVNKSPFAGKEGKFLQSRQIKDRLEKELEKNVALKVYPTSSADCFEICGRGQLHLTVLIENMRREGFELMIGPPTVIEKIIDGRKYEPYEGVEVTVPSQFCSPVIDFFNRRRGEMLSMSALEGFEDQTHLKFLVPTRSMIGVRSPLMTLTKGTVILDTNFDSYKPKIVEQTGRERGSLLATENGVASAYGIEGCQARGQLFIKPRDEVYKDMIIGTNQRPGDMPINPCKTKQLTNMRAAGSDDNTRVIPAMALDLDIAVEYIQEDELVEVTPSKIRMCKHPDFRDWQKKKRLYERSVKGQDSARSEASEDAASSADDAAADDAAADDADAVIDTAEQ